MAGMAEKLSLKLSNGACVVVRHQQVGEAGSAGMLHNHGDITFHGDRHSMRFSVQKSERV